MGLLNVFKLANDYNKAKKFIESNKQDVDKAKELINSMKNLIEYLDCLENDLVDLIKCVKVRIATLKEMIGGK